MYILLWVSWLGRLAEELEALGPDVVFAAKRVRCGWARWARRDLNPGLPGYEPYAGLGPRAL